MAGERIFVCRGGVFSATASAVFSSITHGVLRPRTVSVVDPGAAGSPGEADRVVTDLGLEVDAYFLGFKEALGLIGVGASKIVFKFKGPAAANQKVTIAPVYFTRPITDIPAQVRDAGGKVPVVGVRGFVDFNTVGTLQSAVTFAADA